VQRQARIAPQVGEATRPDHAGHEEPTFDESDLRSAQPRAAIDADRRHHVMCVGPEPILDGGREIGLGVGELLPGRHAAHPAGHLRHSATGGDRRQRRGTTLVDDH